MPMDVLPLSMADLIDSSVLPFHPCFQSLFGTFCTDLHEALFIVVHDDPLLSITVYRCSWLFITVHQ